MAIMVGGSVMRDASGDINDLRTTVNNSYVVQSFLDVRNDTSEENVTIAGNWSETIWSVYDTKFNCTPGCSYGTHNSFKVCFIIKRSVRL